MIRTFLCMCIISFALPNTSWCDNTQQNLEIPVSTPKIDSFKSSENPPPASLNSSKLSSSTHAINLAAVTRPPPPALATKAYVLMDGATGKILVSFNPDQRIAPASLTKMMTSYVASLALKENKIHLTDPVTISEKSWRTGGSKMFVKIGTQVPVQDLMQGIIVDSGNDACVAIAEFVAGTEEAFADVMNQVAQALGMTQSHFVDSTGLPSPNHYSTAHDLATLARALIYSFPEHYQWYSEKWFTYNGIRQPNRNRLLWSDPTVDGVKTGHTDEAGYCLVASAKRNGQRLISVVVGAPSDSARAEDSRRLLDYGFRFFDTHVIYQANTALAKVRVWNGATKTINAGVLEPFVISVIPGQFSSVTYQMHTVKVLQAPVAKGAVLGDVQVLINGKVIDKASIVALENDPIGGLWRRLWDAIAKKF
jgi:D-alanyl-D-alanine carboxypeptidase (penicillin-binding protein 5/6)